MLRASSVLALPLLIVCTQAASREIPAAEVDGGDYTRYNGTNCCAGAGGINIDSGSAHWSGISAQQCTAHCDDTSACHCAVWSPRNGACWRRSACDARYCLHHKESFDSFIKPGGGPVPKPAPAPAPGGRRPYPDTWTPRGPACKDCPNIIFSITDDQDLVLGGWEPMRQTQKVLAERGVTMSQWRIHTPICSPSRSELVSSRYYHNVKSSLAVPTEALDPTRIIYAGSTHVNGSLYKNESFGVYLRREKGYRVAIFGKANFNTYDGFDRWFQGASLRYALGLEGTQKVLMAAGTRYSAGSLVPSFPRSFSVK